jgi:hypothetical protein
MARSPPAPRPSRIEKLKFHWQQLTILENKPMSGYNPNHREETPEQKLDRLIRERQQQEQKDRSKNR